MVEPGRQDPPPRDEAEHRVVLRELLEVVARRLSLVNHRAQGHESGDGKHLGDGKREVGQRRERLLRRPPQQRQRRVAAAFLGRFLALPLLNDAPALLRLRLRHRRRCVEEDYLLLSFAGAGRDGLPPPTNAAAPTTPPRRVAGDMEPAGG